MEADQDTISGTRILEILQGHPLPEAEPAADAGLHFSIPREVRLLKSCIPRQNCCLMEGWVL